MNCYPFIEVERAQRRDVKRACDLPKVSRAACYAARRDQPSMGRQEDAGLAREVRAVHEESKGPTRSPHGARSRA